MQTTTRFASSLGITCLFASPFALGCIAPTVIGGNEGGAGGAVAVAVVSSGISPNTAIAIPVSDTFDRVVISNFGQACPQEVRLPSCPAETLASFSFDLPVSAVAGDVLTVDGLYEVAGQEEGACWGGGGTAVGRVEVLAADESSLTLRLSSLTGAAEVNLEGTYNVPVCGGAPLTNALAIYRGDLGDPGSGTSVVAVSSVGSGSAVATVGSGNPTSGSAVATVGSGSGVSAVASGGGAAVSTVSTVAASGSGVVAVATGSAVASGSFTSGSGTGGGADDDLFLVISNDALICEDPFGATNGCAAPSYHVSIALPAAYQQPGTYPLIGIGNFSAWAPDESSGCQGGGGSYWQGSIRVLHVGDGEIVFALEGTGPISDTIDTADGFYSAALCYGGSGTSVAVSSVGSGEAVAVVSSNAVTVGSGQAQAVAVGSGGY